MTFRERIDQLHRQSAARVLGLLVARFRQFDRAEDALAEAFEQAVRVWPEQGWPNQPEAWLYQVAVRAELDRQKHRAVHQRLAPILQRDDAVEHDESIIEPDQRLAMFFLCAHPSLSVDTQALLILRYCALVPTANIAQAFVLDVETTTRRLHRAKTKLELAGVSFAAPDRVDWAYRLPPVLAALEVLFDQSYADLGGGREAESLARDAMQLTLTLIELMPDEPEVLGLASLMCFCESRRPARLDDSGHMVSLDEQDTTRWHTSLIRRGAQYLKRASTFGKPGPYQWRAAIHAAHARRLELGETPWADIVQGYRMLAVLDDSPMVQINLALAEARINQHEQAWLRFQAIDGKPLRHFRPYVLAEAELLWGRGERAIACERLAHAAVLPGGRAETAFINAKLAHWRQSTTL